MSAPAHIARENGKKGGRPKGSFTKPRLADHMTSEQVEEIIKTAQERAKEGDARLIVFILEQIFGKAPQSIDHTTLGKELPTPILNNVQQEDN